MFEYKRSMVSSSIIPATGNEYLFKILTLNQIIKLAKFELLKKKSYK